MIQGILNGMFEVNSDVNKLQLLAHVELRMPEKTSIDLNIYWPIKDIMYLTIPFIRRAG